MTTIVGNVITNVTQRKIGDGTRVASFRMASNERRFDKETQQWVNGDSLYVTVTCWRKLALGVNASLVKGDPVIVTGRLFTRGYEVEGQKRSVTELEAMAVGPDLSRCLADVSRARRQAAEEVLAEVSPGRAAGGEADGPATDIPGQQTTEHATEAEEPTSRLAVVGAG